MTVSSPKMRALLKSGVAIVVVIVMMLATIGAWEVYKGTARIVANAQADAVFDLLKCYSVRGGLVKGLLQPLNQRLVVVDEIKPGGDQLTILTPQLLCVPAKKVLN